MCRQTIGKSLELNWCISTTTTTVRWWLPCLLPPLEQHRQRPPGVVRGVAGGGGGLAVAGRGGGGVLAQLGRHGKEGREGGGGGRPGLHGLAVVSLQGLGLGAGGVRGEAAAAAALLHLRGLGGLAAGETVRRVGLPSWLSIARVSLQSCCLVVSCPLLLQVTPAQTVRAVLSFAALQPHLSLAGPGAAALPGVHQGGLEAGGGVGAGVEGGEARAGCWHVVAVLQCVHSRAHLGEKLYYYHTHIMSRYKTSTHNVSMCPYGSPKIIDYK